MVLEGDGAGCTVRLFKTFIFVDKARQKPAAVDVT